ncbi:MAG: NAD(P)H-dependent oxidoreductase subunit E [Armatimonadetes bacterium]|nr:NAD(P)H-dependent oxidoreductase subunit E [Armatimonadota bacterium]
MPTLNDSARAQIDDIVSRYPNKKAALLPALWVAQEAYNGQLTREAQAEVADYLDLPRAEVEGVATYYTMYNKEAVGKHHIEVCHNVSCMIFGADALIHHIEHELDIVAGETTADGVFTLNRAECLGACCNAVAIQVGGTYFENVRTKEQVDKILTELRMAPADITPQAGLGNLRTV